MIGTDILRKNINGQEAFSETCPVESDSKLSVAYILVSRFTPEKERIPTQENMLAVTFNKILRERREQSEIYICLN